MLWIKFKDSFRYEVIPPPPSTIKVEEWSEVPVGLVCA